MWITNNDSRKMNVIRWHLLFLIKLLRGSETVMHNIIVSDKYQKKKSMILKKDYGFSFLSFLVSVVIRNH